MNRSAIALGLVVSLTIAAIAARETQEQGSPRSRDFLCNDFWQNSPLDKFAARQHPEGCEIPKAQEGQLAEALVDPYSRLLRDLPIVHSVKFGEIEAETSWKEPCPRTRRFKITRKGKIYIDELLVSRFSDPWILNDREESCDFYNIGVDQIRDLDRDREPEILVGYHTQGAHCCSGLLIYHYDPDRDKYDVLFHYFGEWGYQETKGLKDLDGDGILEFDVPDDSLFFEHGAGVTEIWQYRQGQMYDVTRNFPNQLRQAMSRAWEEYHSLSDEEKTRGYGIGRLTAYLAYKYIPLTSLWVESG